MSIISKSVWIIGFIVLFNSCKGLSQPEENEIKIEETTIGTSIQKLDNNVAIIFQDSKNNYWFANNGVVKYDGKTLIRFTTEDGLYNNRVRDIQEDHLGNIYFDTGSGINKFDGKTIEKLKVIDDSVQARKLEPTDLWFAGLWNMNGAYRWDGENLYHLKLPKHEFEDEAQRMTPNVSVNLYTLYTTFKDLNGYIWLGGCTFGACRFDGKSLFWVSEREMTEIDPGPALGVRSIIQDLDGNFFFASDFTSKYRVVEYDGKTKYEKLTGIVAPSDLDVGRSCMSMVQDNDGNYWMANYQGGIWKYDGSTFTHFPILINKSEADLFSVYKDRQGILWLGTHNAGTFKYNGKDFERFQPKLAEI